MSKKNIILAIILIILASAAWGYNGPFQDWRNKKSRPDNFFEPIDVNAIDKIEVAYNGKTTVMQRAGEKWAVEGYKNLYVGADTAAMMTDRLAQAKAARLELSSGNKDKKADFQTDNIGAEVKLYEGDKTVLDFIVGRMGNDYSSTYVALADADNTYRVESVNLNAAFAHDDWLDRIVFSGDSAKISKIRFQAKGKEFVIEKSGEDWKGTKPSAFQVDASKAGDIASLMTGLTAVKVPEQTFEGTGLEKNSLIIQATGDGVDNTLMIGGQDEDKNYYAKTGTSDTIYLVSPDDFAKLDMTIDKLK